MFSILFYRGKKTKTRTASNTNKTTMRKRNSRIATTTATTTEPSRHTKSKTRKSNKVTRSTPTPTNIMLIDERQLQHSLHEVNQYHHRHHDDTVKNEQSTEVQRGSSYDPNTTIASHEPVTTSPVSTLLLRRRKEGTTTTETFFESSIMCTTSCTTLVDVYGGMDDEYDDNNSHDDDNTCNEYYDDNDIFDNDIIDIDTNNEILEHHDSYSDYLSNVQPVDVLCHIISYLDPTSIRYVSQVNRMIRSIVLPTSTPTATTSSTTTTMTGQQEWEQQQDQDSSVTTTTDAASAATNTTETTSLYHIWNPIWFNMMKNHQYNQNTTTTSKAITTTTTTTTDRKQQKQQQSLKQFRDTVQYVDSMNMPPLSSSISTTTTSPSMNFNCLLALAVKPLPEEKKTVKSPTNVMMNGGGDVDVFDLDLFAVPMNPVQQRQQQQLHQQQVQQRLSFLSFIPFGGIVHADTICEFQYVQIKMTTQLNEVSSLSSAIVDCHPISTQQQQTNMDDDNDYGIQFLGRVGCYNRTIRGMKPLRNSSQLLVLTESSPFLLCNNNNNHNHKKEQQQQHCCHQKCNSFGQRMYCKLKERIFALHHHHNDNDEHFDDVHYHNHMTNLMNDTIMLGHVQQQQQHHPFLFPPPPPPDFRPFVSPYVQSITYTSADTKISNITNSSNYAKEGKSNHSNSIHSDHDFRINNSSSSSSSIIHRHRLIQLMPRLIDYFEVRILPMPTIISTEQMNIQQWYEKEMERGTIRPLYTSMATTTAPALPTNTPKPVECIAIGIGFNENDMHGTMPGWTRTTYGYHGDDGCIYHGSGRPAQPPQPYYYQPQNQENDDNDDHDNIDHNETDDIDTTGTTADQDHPIQFNNLDTLPNARRQSILRRSFRRRRGLQQQQQQQQHSGNRTTTTATQNQNHHHFDQLVYDYYRSLPNQHRTPTIPPTSTTTVPSNTYGPTFGQVGDVIGCGVDYYRHCIFFTCNGRYLGPAFVDVPWEQLLLLNHNNTNNNNRYQQQPQRNIYPVVGIDTNHPIQINYGDKQPFVFDLTSHILQSQKQFIAPHTPPLPHHHHHSDS